jgi:DNA-binding IclR family transcriptional regulator
MDIRYTDTDYMYLDTLRHKVGSNMAPPRKQKNTAAEASDTPAPALKGVRRALEVLEHLAIEPGRAIDIANRLGVSWATLHRTLSQLERGGFVERDGDTGRYTIGSRMWFVGTAYLASHRVLELAQPYLDAAAEKGDLTVQLVEQSDRLAVTLYSHHTSGEVITKATYGYHFPLHCGSKGQVLLAHAPDDFVDSYLAAPLETLTNETVTDPDALRAQLAAIREQGFGFTEGDVQRFTGSISAPVFGRDGRLVAAVCIIGRRTTFRDAARKEEIVEIVLQTAQSISLALGWRPGNKET